MQFTKLADINAQRVDEELEATRHQEDIAHVDGVSQTVLSATSSLIQYLEGHTTKTEVVNQLTSISTPDVDGVIKALEVLDTTIRDRPQADLSGVIQLMQELVNEARQLPKQLPDAPIIPQPIDYSQQLGGLKDAIQAVERVVQAQKLVAEAPVVNVPETNVHVDAPDLQPLQQGFKDIVKAVSSIVIPEYKTDNTAVEKLLKDTNSLLDRILKKPVSGGGGGGGSSWTAIGSNGLPAPLKVDDAGGLVTASVGLFTKGYDYIAVDYPTATTEVYTTRVGGSGGALQETVTVTYTDSTKASISSAART